MRCVSFSTVSPGHGGGQCAPVLLARAHGGGKTGLKQLIPRVRQHLTQCGTITKAVVVVTDEWSSGVLGDSLVDIKIRASLGTTFVFLLAPQPGTGLLHLPISLTWHRSPGSLSISRATSRRAG